MPYIAILVTCALLSITVLLNYLIPNATQVFFYVTAISTILLVAVWMFIVHAYAKYVKTHPELHKRVTLNCPGYSYGKNGTAILCIRIDYLTCCTRNKNGCCIITTVVYLTWLDLFKIYKKSAKIRSE